MKNKMAPYWILILLAAAVWTQAAETTDVRRAPAREKPTMAPEQGSRDANRTRTSPLQEPARAPNRATPAPPTPAPAVGYRNNNGGYNRNGDRGRGGYGNSYRGGGRDQWRQSQFHGSWNFLIYGGSYAYPRPVYVPSVLRIPRYSAGVYIEYAGDDVTGSNFAEALRGKLSSEGLGLSATPSTAALELYLVSMDEDPANPGNGSAVSVSYILVPGYRFITAQLLDVGSQQVGDLAASVASYAGQLLDEYR